MAYEKKKHPCSCQHKKLGLNYRLDMWFVKVYVELLQLYECKGMQHSQGVYGAIHWIKRLRVWIPFEDWNGGIRQWPMMRKFKIRLNGGRQSLERHGEKNTF